MKEERGRENKREEWLSEIREERGTEMTNNK